MILKFQLPIKWHRDDSIELGTHYEITDDKGIVIAHDVEHLFAVGAVDAVNNHATLKAEKITALKKLTIARKTLKDIIRFGPEYEYITREAKKALSDGGA